MPRDYAKKKKPAQKKRGASRSKKKASVPLSLWLLTVFLSIALAGGLIYLKWFKPQPVQTSAQTKSTTSSQKNTSSRSSKKSQPKSDDEVPFYDVHRDLTNKKVVIPKEDLKLPDNYKKYFYTMPCGSFREKARAEELKARIAMVGSKSDLKDIKSKGETWYRVQLGPFNSKRAAERIRHRLQDNGIHDCVLLPHLKSN
ncbi:SPOR domain-containing protein [Aliikangiella sp. IMCC44359]|uniref:SPOR domain-containing protein n=1 Tax=Aliikangiella sp. IMCC44359 TaxID=3459125 RepID=UPI00403B0E0A